MNDPLHLSLPEDEEFACIRLDAELRTRSTCVEWSPENNDTPDIWANLDGVRYAVEVTMIDFESSAGRGSMKEVGRQRSAIKGVVDELNGSGLVHGRWLLSSAPFQSVKNVRSSVRTKLLAFFQSVPAESRQELDLSVDGTRITLRRSSAAGNRIESTWMSVENYEQGADVYELRALLPKAATDKERKMSAVPRPWVLAIIDHNGRAREAWQGLLPKEAEQFDAIYRIESDRAMLIRSCTTFTTTLQ